MLDFLYQLPEGVILGLTIVVIVALISILPMIVQRFPSMRPNDKNTDFVIRTQATLFTMASLVLTFTLVQTDINFRQADALVSNEASRIEQLDRLLTRYGDPDVAAGRPLLRAYAVALAKDEWPNMLHTEQHESSMRTYGALSRHILAINPTTERQNLVLAEMFKTLDTIADVRAQRLNIVSTKLPSLYWWVVLLAMAMLLFVSSSIQQNGFRRVILSAQAAVLGGFLGFVFIMDQPFRGETGLGPDAILKAIEHIDARSN
ncbi:MAG: DUF4239 domain-containing protein [Proteobacteria bacterium]|nr:DUF4239 domain-containing protein [Pseudomonadota bacterium]